LSPGDRNDLLAALANFENRRFRYIRDRISNKKVRTIFRFYKALNDAQETEIWRKQREWIRNPCAVPDDERVEDAGLELDLFAA